MSSGRPIARLKTCSGSRPWRGPEGDPTLPERGERDWLRAHGVLPRKRLGQNFLVDGEIPSLMVARAGWAAATPVLEIGPGAGALTQELLRDGRRVVAVEKDQRLESLLRERFEREIDDRRFTLLVRDLLSLGDQDLDALDNAHGSIRPWVCGNLPYGITTPILEWVLRRRERFGGLVVMVQREVGERILARPGGKEYGSLSVWVQAQARGRVLLKVGRSVFWPRPGVESLVLELEFSDPPPWPGDIPALERVLRAAFGQRRKTLENALCHGLQLASKAEARALIESAGARPGQRAEELSLGEFARLTEQVSRREPRDGA